MPRICCVAGCKAAVSRYVKFPSKDQDPEGYEKWATACRSDLSSSKPRRVCARHFQDGDFLDETWLKLPFRRRVHRGAVPELHLPPASNPPHVCSIRGCQSSGKTLFMFPKQDQPRLVMNWMDACGQNGESKIFRNFADSFVCENHFSQRHFSSEKKLRENAVPDLNLIAQDLTSVCCLPKCKTFARMNRHAFTLVAWPSDPTLSDRWFKATNGVLDRDTLDREKARMCSTHFPAFEYKRCGSLRFDAIPSLVHPDGKLRHWIEHSARPRCCIQNCPGSNSAVRFPKNGIEWKRWAVCCWSAGNTRIHANSGVICVRHFDRDQFLNERFLHAQAFPELFNCCAVSACPSNAMQPDLKFFNFPVSLSAQKAWYKAIRVKKSTKGFNVSSAKICAAHFTPDCFETKEDGGIYLRKNSMPTRVLPKSVKRSNLLLKLDIYSEDSEEVKRVKMAAQESAESLLEDSLEKGGIGVQADDIIDHTTMAFVQRLDRLFEADSRLDEEIAELENCKRTLSSKLGKVLFAVPVVLENTE